MPFGIKLPEELKGLRKKGTLPVRVSHFDELIGKKGLGRGSTLLISGGCGTGKSTFCMQSAYNGILKGEKSVYISFEEQLEKIRKNFSDSYGWDVEKQEKDQRLLLVRIDPFKIARSVEAFLAQKKGDLLVTVEEIEFPFKPDRIIIDSLSALNIAFMGNLENYRYYVRYMFEMLEKYDSVNYIISETELDPGIYSRSGIEEFLADGVLVMYNIVDSVGRPRKRAMEILKLRGTSHERRAIPFKFGRKGIEILKNKKLELRK